MHRLDLLKDWSCILIILILKQNVLFRVRHTFNARGQGHLPPGILSIPGALAYTRGNSDWLRSSQSS